MSSLDEAARLREVKRLLDRIQQLPRIAGLAGNMPDNGLANGYHEVPRANGFGGAARAPVSVWSSEPEPPRDPIAPAFEEADTPALDLHPERESDPLPRALVPVIHPAATVGITPWVLIAATALNTAIAAVLAVVITLGVARRDQTAEAPRIAAPTSAPTREIPARSEAAPPRPVALLAVGSPGEPLRLEALKPARLPLQVRPLEAVQESYILILSGLPANTALWGASRMGADSWLLSPGALQQIEIVVPEWSTSVIEVGAELRRTNGAVVAQSKLWLAVPPPPTPQGTTLSEAAIRDMVKNGDRLLSRGDVAAARALYEKAAAMGSPQAALALGSTYDPRRLWSLGVFGMVGNKERAQHWYRRAAELGHPDAGDRLAALK
jgi:hypothetical protein